jgi:hypothetical protein
MKLQFFVDKKTGGKVYTLKDTKETKPAHYKFKKTKDVVKTR